MDAGASEKLKFAALLHLGEDDDQRVESQRFDQRQTQNQGKDSPFAQEAWAKTNKITVTLASDLNKTVIKAYDVVFPMLAGVGDTAARAAFVIGKDGVIKYAEQTPTPKDLPNFEKVKAALAK